MDLSYSQLSHTFSWIGYTIKCDFTKRLWVRSTRAVKTDRKQKNCWYCHTTRHSTTPIPRIGQGGGILLLVFSMICVSRRAVFGLKGKVRTLWNFLCDLWSEEITRIAVAKMIHLKNKSLSVWPIGMDLLIFSLKLSLFVSTHLVLLMRLHTSCITVHVEEFLSILISQVNHKEQPVICWISRGRFDQKRAPRTGPAPFPDVIKCPPLYFYPN